MCVAWERDTEREREKEFSRFYVTFDSSRLIRVHDDGSQALLIHHDSLPISITIVAIIFLLGLLRYSYNDDFRIQSLTYNVQINS